MQLKKVVKLAVTRQVIVFARVLFFRSADIVYLSTHILMNRFILFTLK